MGDRAKTTRRGGGKARSRTRTCGTLSAEQRSRRRWIARFGDVEPMRYALLRPMFHSRSLLSERPMSWVSALRAGRSWYSTWYMNSMIGARTPSRWASW
jgi:hypothetical protein